MTFNETRIARLWLAVICCLLSACGGDSGQKSGAIKPEQRFDIARAAEASGNLGLARSMYAAAAAETEGDRNMQLRAAEGLARVEAPADAISVLQSVLRRSPGDIEVRRTLGSLQIMNGSLAEAIDSLAIVLKARPDDDGARINEAVALDMLGRHTEAQQLYREALGRKPSDTEAANDLALSLMLSGQKDAAKAIVAPFRGRADLPERMRTTINLVDGTAGSPGGAATPAPVAKSASAGTGPTSLKPVHALPKVTKRHRVGATDDQTPAR